MLRKIGQIPFADAILLVALLVVGSFHEYISCLLSVAMATWLIYRLSREKKLTLYKNTMALAVVAICAGYGLSCLWAVDRGMAFIGFVKFLPAGLYLLCLWQKEKSGHTLTVLPYLGAVMVVVSAVGMQIPALRDAFSVADRLAGFFQYPNTFAMFLLVCELLVLQKEKRKIWDYMVLLVLVAGFIYTGSRTAFVVALLANCAMILTVTKGKVRIAFLASGAIACVVVVILALSGNPVVGRYLRFSLAESTFAGRLLYVFDALPLILKHPFGLGYMGYYYTQQSVQTGLYTVAYIHNDFLQLFLDIGWIPGGLFLWAVIRFFFRKGTPVATKIMAGALCLHSLFDFDLQFVGMLMLLLLLTDNRDKPVTVKKPVFWRCGVAVSAVLSLFMGVVLSLSYFGALKAADTLYPFDTRTKLTMLEQETDLGRANALADEILKTNTQYYAPYAIKAQYAYAQGDFQTLIRYKHQVFEKNPFAYDQYEEYCKMLINGIVLYNQAGDTKSAQICRQELSRIQQRLEANESRLSRLGQMIVDQPITRLPEELQEQIALIGGDGR